MSRLPFELLLAFRYLRPKRTFVSVITLISVIGVTLGVAVLIIVISVMSGFDRELREKILGFNSHLKIFQPGSELKHYQELIKKVEADPEVTGAAPFIIGPVLAEIQPLTGQSIIRNPLLRGVASDSEGHVSILPKSVVEGDFDLAGNSLLVGREFARDAGLELGDPVNIYGIRDLQKWREKNKKGEETAMMPDEYIVRGIFDVGYYEYNAMVIVTSLENAQDLYGFKEGVQGLMVMLKDPFRAREAQARLKGVLGPDFRISVWSDENSGMLNALLVEKNVMFYILFFIIIVAAFGITSVLITFVVQKTREIGILKALGATRAQVTWLFLSQSVLVGIMGVIAGFGLGMLALSYRNEFLRMMNRAIGFDLFPPSIYNFTELPALIVRHDILIICGGSLLICLLAGIFPAWNAGRLNPVEALRHE